ncbi:MAG: hypothetical protein K0S05_1306, partial [Agromyces sp.]|nr:hypothetical protein [Agromyces sp.]
MPTLYAPGKTPVAVTPRGFAVLEAGASAALLARIRALLADGRGLGGVIEALTGAYGASLTAIPGFAVALEEPDGVRVAVRGDFAFDIDATASERVSGAGVTTWTERVIPGVVRVALTTGDDEASGPAELEIIDGIVLMTALVWDAGAPASAPAGDAAVPASDAVPSARRRRGDAAPADAGALQDAESPAAPAAPTGAVPTPGEPPVRGPWSSRVAASDAPAQTAGLIDSSAVPSVVDAETLLPLDSALSPHAAGEPAAGARPPGAPEPGAREPGAAGGEEEFASTTGYDHLWGATVIRSVEEAAVRPEGEDDDAPAVDQAARAGDHDGATISLAQARALREAANGAPAGDAATAGLPEASPLAPPRPPAPGRIRVSTGQVLPLDRTVVIGRRPRSTRVSGTDLPHLVAVDSPEQDISRSHVELRVEGESIVATDLRTTNGTTLL